MTKAQVRELKKQRRIAFFKESGVYGAAVLGSFFSHYVEPYMSNEPITVIVSPKAFIGAFLSGAVAVFLQARILDKGGKGEAAKLKRWKQRAFYSLILGLFINWLWPVALKILEDLI